MVYRISTRCSTFFIALFLMISTSVAGENMKQVDYFNTTHLLLLTENSVSPVVESAYAGTRVYVLADSEAWLDLSNTPSLLGAAAGAGEVETAEPSFAPCLGNPGDIGGTVFQDFNNDGDGVGVEPGQEGIIVMVFDCAGNQVTGSPVVSDASGNWTITGLNDGEDYRVEFSLPTDGSLDFLQPSYAGTDNGTNVQFVQPGTCEVDYGVVNQLTYCTGDYSLITPCYIEGDAVGDLDALVYWSYENEGEAPLDKKTVGTNGQVGATWGLAYDPVNLLVYSSVVVKRGVGLYEGSDGSGTDVILATNPFSATPNAEVWLELTDDLGIATDDGSFPSNTDRGLANTPLLDPATVDLVGKTGLGDIEISDDGTTLYVMNLYDRTLYAIDIATKSLVASYPVPDPGCTNGTYRPWATKYADGKVYVGVVCDASQVAISSPPNATDDAARPFLEAIVYSLDGGSYTEVLRTPLDYDREPTFGYSGGTCTDDVDGWYGWVDEIPAACEPGNTSYPQPILTDIEFDDNGGMILGFSDRTGFQITATGFTPDGNEQIGVYAGGDILYACGSGGTWTIENPTDCTNSNGGAINGTNNTYPQFIFDNGWPNVGEYFMGDFFHDGGDLNAPGFFPTHAENTIGGLAYIPGSNEIVSTAYDPVTGEGTLIVRGGVIKLSTLSGRRTVQGFQLYDSNVDAGTGAKGVGLGDLELVCAPPPIQIGNYAWLDENADGVQDACEDPLPGLAVKLYRKDAAGTPVQIASTITDANGNYYFSSATATDANLNWIGMDADTTVQRGEEYFVAFCGDNGFDAGNNTIDIGGATYCLSPNDTGEGTNPDLNDSDATVQDILGTMLPAYCTQPGEVNTTNHTFDVGFKPFVSCDLSITSVSPVCAYDPADGQSTFTVTVNVAWDYAELTTTNELIEVTFAGQTLTVDPASMGTGTGMVEFTGVAGPAYEQLVEATFATRNTCSATSLVDLIACTPDCVDGAGTIGGNVFNDFDNDGADAGAEEVGQENVLVEVYDCDGVLVCSTYTNADGNWSCAGLNDADEYRVEFSTPLQPHLQPSFAGTDNGTNTQFVTAPTCEVDYGVIDPADYCDVDNPQVVTTCYDYGAADGANAAGPALISADYDLTTKEAPLATFEQIGSTWGVMYQRSSNYLYTTSFLKRNVGLADGLGHVYITDATTGFIGSFDLQGVNGIDLGTVNRDPTNPDFALSTTGDAAIDLDAFGKVATVGFGDVDLYNDETIFTVNLNSRSLITIDVSDPALLPTDGSTVSGALVNEFPLVFPDACPGGVMRPFGLTIKGTLGYLGVVCDASVSMDRNDLIGYVYSFDPENPGGGLTQVLSFPLNYERELSGYFSGTPGADEADNQLGDWQPWVSEWDDLIKHPRGAEWYIDHASPVISDIEFAADGSMVLGLVDRLGHQMGTIEPLPLPGGGPGVTPAAATIWSAGDILKACFISGTYVMEGGAGCDNINDNQSSTFLLNTNDGPSGVGEFFYQDFYTLFPDVGHAEVSLGGLAVLPGSNEVISTSYDATSFNQPGGYIKYDVVTGQRIGEITLVEEGATGFNKAAGVGDAEILCGPPPIQIGNYVWFDADEDGVQDACEEPLPGIPVSLYNKETMMFVAVDTTGPNGEYYFNDVGSDTTYAIVFGYDANDASSPWNATDMELVIDGVPYGITVDSTGEGTNTTLNDSDVTLMDMAGLTGYPIISYTVGDTTDHTLDAGFVQLATFDLALRKVINTTASPGPYEPGDAVTFTVAVFNQGDIDATDIEVTDYVPTGLTFTSVAAGSLTTENGATAMVTDNGGGVFTVDALAAGDSLFVDMVLTIDMTFMGTELINYAEITGFDDDGDPLTAPPVDEDSTPGDNEGVDETGTDNNIDDDGFGGNGTADDPTDNDDYDPAILPVTQTFDLALTKVLDASTTPGPFSIGSPVAYVITVFNQGTLDATGVTVADYIPDGLSLVASADWSDSGTGIASWTTPFDLAAGAMRELNISFTIDADFTGTELINTAEITAGTNALGLPDEDSDVYGDDQNTAPETGTDNNVDDDGANGNGTPDDPLDKDEFDPETIQVEYLSIGSTVFIDANNNGVQDAGEAGIGGVEVLVYAEGAIPGTDAPVGNDTTEPNGDYFVGGLAPGNYFVVINTAPAAAPISSNGTTSGFTETDPDDDQDNDDEGLQPGGAGTAVTSGTVTLALRDEPVDGTIDGTESAQGNLQDNGEIDANGNMTLDFGFFAPVSVGDTAFVDLDGDGLQTTGEPGIGGVTVVLLDSNGDTLMVDADGNMITGVTTTAADGSYLFDNLPPGSYSVIFDISSADNAEFYEFTTPNAGDDGDDSDNSITLTDFTAQSDPTAFLNSGEQDLTLDVGVVCAVEVMVAEPFTICSTQPINLTPNTGITPGTLGGMWTSSGDGRFLDDLNQELNGDPFYRFGEAVLYVPGPDDIAASEVTLTLTTFNPAGPCEPVSNSVTVTILKVDCGEFLWDGK